MSEPPTKSAGPESAADVGIESGLKIERAENTHLDSALGQRFEDEDVGTGLTRNRSGRRSAQRTLWVSALYLSPKLLNDLRILQTGFRERPLPPEARELAR